MELNKEQHKFISELLNYIDELISDEKDESARNTHMLARSTFYRILNNGTYNNFQRIKLNRYREYYIRDKIYGGIEYTNIDAADELSKMLMREIRKELDMELHKKINQFIL